MINIPLLLEVAIPCISIFLLSTYFFGYLPEKRKWNNGKCKVCGCRWEMFDMDSQGGRMYKCKCEYPYNCDISYPVDKIKETKSK